MNCPSCGAQGLDRIYAPYKVGFVLLDQATTETYVVVAGRNGLSEAIRTTLARARHYCRRAPHAGKPTIRQVVHE